MQQERDKTDKLDHVDWQYDPIAKTFHWILAILIIGMLTLGWYMMSLGDAPGSGWYFDLHKSFGILVGSLIILRLLWRLFHKPGLLPLSVPLWQARASRIVHWFLYFFMVCMPLAGFLAASFGKGELKFFGLALPNWIKKNHDLSEALFTLHGYIAWILVILISLHLLAAFKHLLINKDNVFRRMWF